MSGGLGIGDFFYAMAPAMNEVLGPAQTIELRRPSALAIAEQAVPVTVLTLVHDTLAGATSLDLAVLTETGLPLAGSLLANTPLSLAATTYKLAVPAVPAGSLITVAIAPPLAADASGGDPVTLTPYVSYSLASCRVAHKSMRDAGLPHVQMLTVVLIPQISVDAAGLPGGVALEDALVLEGETGGTITAMPVKSGGFVKVLYGP